MGICLAACLVDASFAQEPGKGVTATVEVTILTLDVIAVDGKERPVLGLSKEDFEVKVGGRVQPIEGFDAPVSPTVAQAAPTESAQEYLPGTTLPAKPGGPPPYHLLLYIDEEELPSVGVSEAARAALEYARTPEGGPRLSLVSHLGTASVRLWEEATIDRMVRELEALVSASEAAAVDYLVLDRSPSFDQQPRMAAVAPRSTRDQRQRLETALIHNILDAQDPGSLQNAYATFSTYLRDERVRVRDSIRELRAVCERFARLGDRRHVVLFSEGFERIPGMNAVEHLRVAVEAARAAGGGGIAVPPQTGIRGDLLGSIPKSLAGRLVFDNSPLSDLPDLESWLAASGVTLHFVDTSRAADMQSADRDTIAAMRDLRGDIRNLQDGGTRLADVTGGLVRLVPAGLGNNLGGVATAAAQTYRIAVRLTNVDVNKPYRIQVAVKKSGVKARARRTFLVDQQAPQAAAGARTPEAGAQTERAQDAARHARIAEKQPGALRSAKEIHVGAEWKGKWRAFYKLDVSIPYDDLRFTPQEDSMVASVKVVINAASADSPWKDTFVEDVFLSLTGPEFSAASGKTLVKTITLALPAGRIDLTISVNDVLENSFGLKQLRVEAQK